MYFVLQKSFLFRAGGEAFDWQRACAKNEEFEIRGRSHGCCAISTSPIHKNRRRWLASVHIVPASNGSKSLVEC